MQTEPKNRIRVKVVLECIAFGLLGVQLLSLALNPDSSKLFSVAGPTQTAVSVTADNAELMCTARVRARLLNQRSGPGENYNITGNAANGEVFTVAGWDETQQWILVSTSTGPTWMYAHYLTLSDNCSGLPVESLASNPGQSTTQVAVLSPTSAPGVTAPSEVNMSYSSAEATLSTIFTAEVQYWAPEITAWAATYRIDPNLIATVLQIESCGNPTVHSAAGAQGLFQVMPFHFADGEDMLDVQTNARRGLEYLQGALKLAQGNVALALAGYNGGYGVIYGPWALETQRYSYWGSHIYSEAVSGVSTSITLQEWLAAGGANLCAVVDGM